MLDGKPFDRPRWFGIFVQFEAIPGDSLANYRRSTGVLTVDTGVDDETALEMLADVGRYHLTGRSEHFPWPPPRVELA